MVGAAHAAGACRPGFAPAKANLFIPYRYFRFRDVTDIAEQQSLKITDCRLGIYSPSGHFVQYQQPELCNREVLAFMNEEE